MTFTKQEADAIVAKGDTAQLELLKSAEVVDADGNKLSYNVIEKAAPAAAVDNKAISEMVAAEVAKAQKAVAPAAKPDAIDTKGDIKVEPSVLFGSVKSFVGDRNGKSAIHRAHDFGQWFLAVRGNKSAREYCQKAGLLLKTHLEGNNDRGGYLVPEQFEADLIRLRVQYGVARQWARVRPMTSDTLTVPRQTGDVTARWVAEASATTRSTITFDQVRLVAKKLMATVVASNELSEDAAVSIGDIVAESISRQFAFAEDDALFNGDGTSTYGGIVGIRSKLVTINGTDDGGGLTLAAGTGWSGITLANLQSLVGRLPTYARVGASFVASPFFFDSVMSRLALASGGTAPVDIANGVSTPRFLGYPVTLAEVMPTSSASQQVPLIFGNGLLSTSLGDRRQTSITVLTEATIDGVNLADTDQVGIRGVSRVDINNHDLGTSTAAGPVVGLVTG